MFVALSFFLPLFNLLSSVSETLLRRPLLFPSSPSPDVSETLLLRPHRAALFYFLRRHRRSAPSIIAELRRLIPRSPLFSEKFTTDVSLTSTCLPQFRTDLFDRGSLVPRWHIMDVDSDPNSSKQMHIDSKGPVVDKGKVKDDLSDSIKGLQISDSSSITFKRKPVIIIVVGMAGSGKTTFLHRLVCHTQSSNIRGYVLNLDPAVMTLPFGANIDIRDTVRYKEVMKEYNLGPNGGIMTSLNLFATKFDEVISVIERRADQLDYVLVDTPGQIEIFTWSASGAIITEAFASTFPTIIAYVMDTPRSSNPVTFMSNMLYACSILYKTRLPLVLTFNKIDVANHEFALEWMQDFEAFQAALDTDSSYTSTLARSLSLALEEFYKNMHSVGVSAVSGAGMEAFFTAIESSAKEYMENYKADLDKRRAEKQRLETDRRKENMERLRKDMEKSKGQSVVLSTGLKDKESLEMEDEADEEDEEEELEDVRFSEEETEEDEGEDEEVVHFGF